MQCNAIIFNLRRQLADLAKGNRKVTDVGRSQNVPAWNDCGLMFIGRPSCPETRDKTTQ